MKLASDSGGIQQLLVSAWVFDALVKLAPSGTELQKQYAGTAFLNPRPRRVGQDQPPVDARTQTTLSIKRVDRLHNAPELPRLQHCC